MFKPKTPPVIQCCHYTKEQFSDGKNGDLDKYNAALAAGKLDDARRLRDDMVYHIIYEIDDVFGRYETSFLKNRAGVSITGDTVQAGLAAGATAVNGARGKTIIDAFLAGVTGLDLSVDKHLFAQQTAQAIMNSMETRRNRVHSTILTRLATQNIDEYPFEAARSDLAQYFYAGTLAGGLEELSTQTGAQADESKKALQAQKMLPATPQDALDAKALNDAIRSALTSNDPKQVQKVKDFLTALGDQNVSSIPDSQLFDAYYRNHIPQILSNADARKAAFQAARQVQLIK